MYKEYVNGFNQQIKFKKFIKYEYGKYKVIIHKVKGIYFVSFWTKPLPNTTYIPYGFKRLVKYARKMLQIKWFSSDKYVAIQKAAKRIKNPEHKKLFEKIIKEMLKITFS